MFPSLFPVQNGFDPLAPFPTQAPPPFDAPATVSPDLMNAGISPVGRPADLSSLSSGDPSNGGIAAAGRDRALAKLQRQSKGDALMALGAQLLGSRNFGEGLSRGIMAYQETLRANRPTSKPIGDGEYEEVTDPRTGQVTYRTTPIHADKVSDRNKPTIAGDKVYQYGLDASGHYDGTAKDLTPPHLKRIDTHDAAGNPVVLYSNDDTGEVFDAKGSSVSGPTATAPNAAPGAPGVAPAPPPNDPSRTAAAGPAGGGGFDPAIQFVLQHEGSKLNPSDWNGQPVKYGINQKYHPDVANLTEDGAKAIYKSDYWDKSGAASLPAPMQLPFFDTYVRNPSKAQAFLAQSGGDPNKFMALREAWDQAASKSHPGDANGLANRDRDLRSTMSGPDTSQPYYQGAPTAAPAAAPEPAAAPDNQWGLQPHTFGPGAPAVRYLNGDEKKAAGYPTDAVVQRNAKGADTVLDKGTAAGEGPLSPGEEEFYAQAVMAGTPVNQLVPGMGKTAAAQRHQVMGRVAKDAGADGLTGGDFAIQLAHYKGSVANVTNLEKQLGTIKGNEETARLNGEQFIKTSAMIPAQTSSKLLNMPIQTYLRSTGDPNVARMDVAARTFAIEYAKVVQGTPNGGGQITDSAANEAIKIMAGDYSLKQKMAAYDQSKIDMQNRITALQGNLQSSYSHMKDRAPELTGNVQHVSSIAEAKALQPGTHFIFNGVERIRH